jgi:hypothetical protein
MSEMSSLSHEYASTSDFSRELNDAVLVLKRASIRPPAGAGKAEVEKAVRRVREILANLLVRFGEATGKASDEFIIPEDVVARIESNHSGEQAYFVADVKRLASGLAPERPIDKSDLKLLDSICTAADASASATFRKLWRR